jgi:hypothetical protein
LEGSGSGSEAFRPPSSSAASWRSQP